MQRSPRAYPTMVGQRSRRAFAKYAEQMNLKPELAARLSRLAAHTGQSEDYFAEQAIREFLDDREEYLLAIADLEKNTPEDLESLRRRL